MSEDWERTLEQIVRKCMDSLGDTFDEWATKLRADCVLVSRRDLKFVLANLLRPEYAGLWAALDKGGVGSQVRVACERLRKAMEEEHEST